MTSPRDLSAVSVVCPVYDQADRLPTLIVRLRRLRLRGCQVIVVDDGSRDGSSALLRASADDLEVVYLAENAGVARARNEALRRVRGRFVWFCDSDDEWEPDIVEALLSSAEAVSADVAVTGARIVHVKTGVAGATNERLVDVLPAEIASGSEALAWMLRGRLQGYLWDKLFRVESLGELEFVPMRSQSDFLFTFEAIRHAQRVVRCDGVRYTHILRPGSLSQSGTTAENLGRCWRRVSDDLSTSDELRDDVRYFKVWFYLSAAAGSVWRSGLPRLAARHQLESVRKEARWRDLSTAWAHGPMTFFRVAALLVAAGHSGEVVGLVRVGRHLASKRHR